MHVGLAPVPSAPTHQGRPVRGARWRLAAATALAVLPGWVWAAPALAHGCACG